MTSNRQGRQGQKASLNCWKLNVRTNSLVHTSSRKGNKGKTWENMRKMSRKERRYMKKRCKRGKQRAKRKSEQQWKQKEAERGGKEGRGWEGNTTFVANLEGWVHNWRWEHHYMAEETSSWENLHCHCPFWKKKSCMLVRADCVRCPCCWQKRRWPIF